MRGASHLLDSVEAQADIERIRTLFDDIERKNDLIRLLELAAEGDGVRIFIGSENRLFSLSGSSIVAAPYANAQGKIVGVIGVLGPTRLNYARIIPMVDHTAKVVGRLLGLMHDGEKTMTDENESDKNEFGKNDDLARRSTDAARRGCRAERPAAARARRCREYPPPQPSAKRPKPRNMR